MLMVLVGRCVSVVLMVFVGRCVIVVLMLFVGIEVVRPNKGLSVTFTTAVF